MRNVPITITLPESLVRDLHMYVSRRQISKFVAEATQKSMEARKELMARDFIEAAQDEELHAECELFDNCAGDGLDETNAY